MVSRMTLLFGLLLSLLLLALASAAEAHTCSSSCSQIRRACVRSAKAVRDQDRYLCDIDRDTCVAACDADPLVCPGASCEACKDACEVVRDQCRADAELTRTLTRESCTTARTSCDAICTDPIDGACVRDCRADTQHMCVRPALRSYVQCKRACPTGQGRRACGRVCRHDRDVGLQSCFDGEALCVGVCIGVTLP